MQKRTTKILLIIFIITTVLLIAEASYYFYLKYQPNLPSLFKKQTFQTQQTNTRPLYSLEDKYELLRTHLTKSEKYSHQFQSTTINFLSKKGKIAKIEKLTPNETAPFSLTIHLQIPGNSKTLKTFYKPTELPAIKVITQNGKELSLQDLTLGDTATIKTTYSFQNLQKIKEVIITVFNQ